MDLLAFGDPEGKLQKKSKEIIEIIEKYKPDYVIFLGDYFPLPYDYYKQIKKYLKTKDLFDLYPEAKIVEKIFDKYNFVFVYGNKDLRPETLRLRREKERKRPNNFLLTFNKWGEVEEFFIINGSNVFALSEKPRNLTEEQINKVFEERDKILLEKFGVKLTSNKIVSIDGKKVSIRKIRRELKKIYEDLWKKYPLAKRIIKYAYWYRLDFVSRMKSNKDILLTHTPPNLSNEEVIFGVLSDTAIYKIIGEDSGNPKIKPVHPNDPDAIRSNVGLKPIKKFILKNQPRIVFCCHIHEGSGITRIKETETIIVNPGSYMAFQNKKRIIPYVFVRLKESNVKIEMKSFYGDFNNVLKL